MAIRRKLLAWLREPVGAMAGLVLLTVLTVLAIGASWLAEDSASVGYWLSSQLVLVLYGVLAWWASRSTDGPAAAPSPSTDASPAIHEPDPRAGR